MSNKYVFIKYRFLFHCHIYTKCIYCNSGKIGKILILLQCFQGLQYDVKKKKKTHTHTHTHNLFIPINSTFERYITHT